MLVQRKRVVGQYLFNFKLRIQGLNAVSQKERQVVGDGTYRLVRVLQSSQTRNRDASQIVWVLNVVLQFPHAQRGHSPFARPHRDPPRAQLRYCTTGRWQRIDHVPGVGQCVCKRIPESRPQPGVIGSNYGVADIDIHR